jgi:hypothetical protein
MRGWAIIELHRIRAGVELELRRRDISARERKAAAEHLHLISLVESEIDAINRQRRRDLLLTRYRCLAGGHLEGR